MSKNTRMGTANVVADGLTAVLEAADGMGLPEWRACEMANSYLREMSEASPGLIPDDVPHQMNREDLKTLIADLKRQT